MASSSELDAFVGLTSVEDATDAQGLDSLLDASISRTHFNDDGLGKEATGVGTLNFGQEPEKVKSMNLDSSAELNDDESTESLKAVKENVGKGTESEIDTNQAGASCKPTPNGNPRKRTFSNCNSSSSVKAVKRRHLLQVLNESIKWGKNTWANIYSAMLSMESEEDDEQYLGAVRSHLFSGLDILEDHNIQVEIAKAMFTQQQEKGE